MQLGVIYPQTELGGCPAAVREFGVSADKMGFDFLVAYDHVLGASHNREEKLWGPYSEHHPFHDPFVMFGYLAAITSRIEFVTGILILPQRQTALVARQAADVDLLSGERLRLGVGLGWNPVEYEALNSEFTSRGSRVSEQIEVLRALWKGVVLDFSGNDHRIDRAALNPSPKRQIPVWMGGFADVALRRAARIADGFIFADTTGNSLDMLQILRKHLSGADRGSESFGFQCNMLSAKTVEQAIGTALRWRNAGGTHAAINSMGLGFRDPNEHLEFVHRVKEGLAKEI